MRKDTSVLRGCVCLVFVEVELGRGGSVRLLDTIRHVVVRVTHSVNVDALCRYNSQV